MAFAASTPVTIVTWFNVFDRTWAWEAYRERILIMRSPQSFSNEGEAAEAGRNAAVSIRRERHALVAGKRYSAQKWIP